MLLEVIASNIDDIKQASAFGADRIELCIGVKEDGYTPSYGLMEGAVEHATIPINALIRPYASGFHYTDDEFKAMLKEIEMARKAKVSGVVIGALTADQKIDHEALKRMLDVAGDLDVTYHRAIDVTENVEGSLEELMRYQQISRVLTAGGTKPAYESIDTLKRMVELTKGEHLQIMPGYGLNATNIEAFLSEVNVSEIHMGSGVRVDGDALKPLDHNKIRSIKELLTNNKSCDY